MKQSTYPEPDGYLKMRLRDFMAGAFVVACFALAALVSNLWRSILRNTGPDARMNLSRFAKQDK